MTYSSSTGAEKMERSRPRIQGCMEALVLMVGRRCKLGQALDGAVHLEGELHCLVYVDDVLYPLVGRVPVYAILPGML